jgi:diguanylate cyclase (GGDEF)-like protein/PAS domain S-box-containing protein
MANLSLTNANFDSAIMFEQWPDGVIIVDENEVIVLLNSTARELLAYRDEDIIGKKIHQFLCAPASSFQHPEVQCPFTRRGLFEDNVTTEAWWITHNGNYLHVDVKTITLKQDNKQYTLFNFQDCSKRNYSEHELQRLALYAELNPTLIIEFDQEGLIHYSNPAMLDKMAESGFDKNGLPHILPKNVKDLIKQCLTDGQTINNIESKTNGYWFLWNFHPVLKSSTVQAYAIDISKRKQMETTLFSEKEKFLVTLNSILDGVITVDLDEKITYINPNAERLSGCNKKQIFGKAFKNNIKLLSINTHQEPNDNVHQCLAKGEVISHKEHVLVLHSDGYVTTVKEIVAPMFDQQNKVIGAVVILHDVTETYQLEQKLSYQATHDQLTGLINRNEFEIRLNHIINIAYSDKVSHAMLYFDLDNFKIINDTCGHLAGDQLLRQITQILKHKLRRGDILARLGGDEFGAILESCPIEMAKNIAEEICLEVNNFNFIWENQDYTIAVSIGVVPINEESDNVDQILSRADASCYAAKDLGRNQVHIYQSDDLDLIAKQGEMLWVSRINKALKNERFILYFQLIQPVFHSEGLHFEVLIRMLDDHNNIIPPGIFLPAAEHYDLIKKIDRWVVRHMFEWLADNPDVYQQISLCSINLSGQSIIDPNFIHFITQQLAQKNIAAEKICFEVTETVAINNLVAASRFIDTLKEMGCVFSLDDFGSGMSSFGYLKQLNVDFLKIDGQFVKDILIDPIDEAMVKSINDIGHTMGLKTIAEYVETNDIYEKVKSMKINFAQGYGIAKPEPLNDLRLLVSAK